MEFAGTLICFLHLFFRALGLISVLPLDYSLNAVGMRFVFAGGLAAIHWNLDCVPGEGVDLVLGLLFDFLLGLCLGFPVALLVSIAAMLGELFDVMRGQQLGSLYDPLSQEQQSASATLFNMFAWSMLLQSGALCILVAGYSESYAKYPAGSLRPEVLEPLAWWLLSASVGSLERMFLCALPLIAIFLSIEVLAGFCAKLMPQIQLSSEAIAIKSVVGLVVLINVITWIDWPFLLQTRTVLDF